MMDSSAIMAATGCTLAAATKFAVAITEACQKWHIVTPDRQCAFLAQIAYESALFSKLEEGLFYTTPQRLVEVFGSKFRMPASFETSQTVFKDGLRNPNYMVKKPVLLANLIYGGRFGNGDESSGDGYRYRGQGLIQLTFKANYEKYAHDAQHPEVLASPELLQTPLYAADSAGWYFDTHNCNELADFGLFDKITKTINTPMEGLQRRKDLWQQARLSMGLSKLPT